MQPGHGPTLYRRLGYSSFGNPLRSEAENTQASPHGTNIISWENKSFDRPLAVDTLMLNIGLSRSTD